MKRSFMIGLMAWGLASGMAWASAPADQKVGQDLQQLKKDYTRKVDKDLKSIGSGIRHLKHKTLRTGDRLKADVDKDIKKLEAQKAEADQKFAELERSTGDAWKDLRHGVDEAVANLRKAVDEAAQRFKDK